MMLIRTATHKISAQEFQGLSQDLMNRGFTRDGKGEEKPVMYGAMGVDSFRREFSGFVLSVGGGREASDVLDAVRRQATIEGGPVILWARCSASCDPKVAAFTDITRHKSHLVRIPDQSGNALYEADLIPYPDAGLLINGSLKLQGAVAMLGRDAEFAAAVDARAVHAIFTEAQGKVDAGSRYRDYAVKYLAEMLQALKGKFEYEFRRVLSDPAVNEALGQIADR